MDKVTNCVVSAMELEEFIASIPYCPGTRSEVIFSKLIDVTQCALKPDGQHQAGDLQKSKTSALMI